MKTMSTEKKAFFTTFANIRFEHGNGKYIACDLYNKEKDLESDIVYTTLFYKKFNNSENTYMVEIYFNYKTFELVKVKPVGTGSRKHSYELKTQGEAFYSKVILSELMNVLHLNAIVEDNERNNKLKEIEEPQQEEANNTTTYQVAARSFSSYQEAVTYCNESDFDPSLMIQVREETQQTDNKEAYQAVNLQYFSSDNNTNDTQVVTNTIAKHVQYRNDVRYWMDSLKIAYVVEYTKEREVEEIYYSNLIKEEHDTIQSAIERVYRLKADNYYNISLDVQIFNHNTQVAEDLAHELEQTISTSDSLKITQLRREVESEQRKNEEINNDMLKAFLNKYNANDLFEEFKKEYQKESIHA